MDVTRGRPWNYDRAQKYFLNRSVTRVMGCEVVTPALFIGSFMFALSATVFLPLFPKTTAIYCSRNNQHHLEGAFILPSDPFPSKFLVAPLLKHWTC